MFKKLKTKLTQILVWSQKYTKTDMVYLARGGFWLSLGQVIISLSSLVSAIAFANLLLPETYGTFKFVISFVGILSIPTLSGMNTALIRTVAKGNEGTLFPILKTKMKWGVLGALGSILVAIYYFYQENNILGFSFLLISVFIPFLASLEVWMHYLNGKKNFKPLAKYKSSTKVLAVLIMISTLFFTQNLLIILLVHFSSNVLIRLFFLLLTIKKYPPNKKHDSAAIGFGKHLSLMGLSSSLAKEMDKLLVFYLLGPVQLAIYSFALKPLQEIKKPLLDSLSKLSLPKLSQKNVSTLKQTLPEKTFKLFLVIIPVVAIYILIAPYFFQIFFPQYMESVIYSQVFALSILLFPKAILGQTLVAHASKKQLYILRLSTSAFKIVLFLILLPLMGLWGAIITLIATEVFSLFLVIFFFKNLKPS